MKEKYPFNLPIWRGWHRATSPDGKWVAEIDPAYEVSMGNPTIGTLTISCGISMTHCNPSFVWSDDSRYLAVPRYVYWGLLFRKQRVVVIDVREKMAYVSRKHAWYFQPKSFDRGKLIVTVEPFRTANEATWELPKQLGAFKSTMLNCSDRPEDHGTKP